MDRAGLPALLGRYLPAADARVRSAPAVAVRLVVTNLLIGRQPLYALGEWAAPFGPGLLGLADDEAGAVNDDRVGRALEALFDADRASLLTELILGVVREFGVDTAELETMTYSPNAAGLMERVIQTQQMVTLRKPFDHADEVELEAVCELLMRSLAAASDGLYQIDGRGWFTASGELLVQEY